VGSPISGALLNLHGAGFAGWQWMFLLEGIPAMILGAIVLAVLPDTPEEATWLKTEERTWLVDILDSERRAETPVQGALWSVVFSPTIWLLSLVYFGVSTTMYGVTLWLPTVIRTLSGLSYFWTGVVAILPFLLTVIAMVWVGMLSDRTGERRWHTAIPAFAAAAALVVAGYGASTIVVVTGIALGLAGAESMCGPFWAMATSRMDGLSAAAGIAVINSLANLGGYYGPDIIGLFRSANGGFRGGLLAIAATVTLSGLTALFVGRNAVSKPGVAPA
jgi:ACS family tartrate transporter-like MFS transporter